MRIRSLIAIVITLILLTGCNRRDPTATDVMAKLLSQLDIPPMTVYFEGAMPENDGYLPLIEEEKLYGGRTPSALSDEYAIALCIDDQVYEIHVFHSLDGEKAEQIENILRRRQTALQKQENYLYDPDNPGAQATVWRKGKWVCLLVTNDNETAKDILQDII